MTFGARIWRIWQRIAAETSRHITKNREGATLGLSSTWNNEARFDRAATLNYEVQRYVFRQTTKLKHCAGAAESR